MIDGFGTKDQYLQANDVDKAVSSPRKDGRLDTSVLVTEVTMEEEVAKIEERCDKLWKDMTTLWVECWRHCKIQSYHLMRALIFFKIPKLRETN